MRDAIAPFHEHSIGCLIGLQATHLFSKAGATDNVAVTGYSIYRNGSLLTSTSGTSFTDGSTSAGTTYTYYVIAKDAAGHVSGQSPSATIVR